MMQKYVKNLRLPNVYAKNLFFFLIFAAKKMKLHIFNPEHDLALASGLSNFTAPHAARRLRADLGYLPALWADEGDCVLVENAAKSRLAFGRLRARIPRPVPVISRFVEASELAALSIDEVEPWGWDLALRAYLVRHCVEAVPSEQQIAAIRDLSHRRHATTLLEHLVTDPSLVSSEANYKGTVPTCPISATSFSDVEDSLRRLGRIVVKAPWSSSGRGVRFIADGISATDAGWIRNVIARQGTVMVEPYYNKVKDFGMEFESDGHGGISYLGLSLFETRGGAYTGNIVASEDDKRALLARYVEPARLDAIAAAVSSGLANIVGVRYRGPLGVDMMIVARGDVSEGFLLHPCVEINLRRTMGHVALAVPSLPDGRPRSMRIELTDKYRLRLRRL